MADKPKKIYRILQHLSYKLLRNKTKQTHPKSIQIKLKFGTINLRHKNNVQAGNAHQITNETQLIQ